MEIKGKTPDIRFLNDMKEVIYDKEWLKQATNFGVYYMYRNIKKKNGLQYDITIIKPKKLGKEFAKTKGHEHIGKYQEIFIILEGEAIFLMQKMKGNKIEDIYAVKTKKGEAAIVPHYYSHIAINPSKKDIKMGNWIPKNCKRNYQSVKEKQGMGYYYTKNGWIKNNNYNKVPELRFEKPLKKLPHNLDFLK
jgi:glucose-6-phosphate isomerase